MSKRQYFVYILTNYTNNVLYTGITNDLKVRIYSHKNKIGADFTTKYNVNKLVYYEIFENPGNAIRREKAIKNLVRRKKIDLIDKFNSKWEDLYHSL